MSVPSVQPASITSRLQSFKPTPTTAVAVIFGVIGIALAIFFFLRARNADIQFNELKGKITTDPQVAQLQKKVADLQEQLAKPAAVDPQIATLTDRLQALERDYAKVLKHNTELTSTETHLRDKQEKLESEITKLTIQSAKEKREAEQAASKLKLQNEQTIKQLQQEIEKLKGNLKTTTSSVQVHRETINSLQKQLDDALAETKALKTSLDPSFTPNEPLNLSFPSVFVQNRR